MRLRRSTSRRMRPTFRSTTGSSRMRARSSCAADEMPKSGLRSSCATPAATSPIASRRRFCSTRRTSQARSIAAEVCAASDASRRSAASRSCGEPSTGAQIVMTPRTPSVLDIGAVSSTAA